MKANVLNPEQEMDSFTTSMHNKIGKIINVVIDDENWFMDTDEGFFWHKSWLEFIEEKPIMSDGDKFLKGLVEEIDGGNLIAKESSHWFLLYLDGIREYLSRFEN